MSNGDWDFEVERIQLDDLSIDAGHRLGMVIVQPSYEVDADAVVPFRLSQPYREAQKDLVERAFQIRAAEQRERGLPFPFVLFPELSIPVVDPDGLACVQQQIAEAPGEVVFIGGLEGMRADAARDLEHELRPGLDAALAFGDGEFVNTCVIVIKSAREQLSWYLQAKVRPSQREQPRIMAHGHRVLYFVAPRLSFLSQICFDQIAAEGHEPINSALCRQLIQHTQTNAAALDFVFVPQCTDQPDHPSVKQNAKLLLNYQDRALNNDTTAIVAVNRAAKAQGSFQYQYGRSGFHYRAGRWRPPPSDIGPIGYELYDCDSVTSAVVRKRTQGIHVSTWVPPSLNVGDSGNPRYPLENPRSYLITEDCDPTPCSCLSRGANDGRGFVLCDCLPCKLRDTLVEDLPHGDACNLWDASDEAQRRRLAQHYKNLRANLLNLSCGRAVQLLDLLFLEYQGRKANPDTWQEPRVGAITELASTLCVLQEWDASLTLATREEWTAFAGDHLAVVVLDGADRKNSWHTLEQAYRREFNNRYFRPEMRQRPVLFVAMRSLGTVEPSVFRSDLDLTEPRCRGHMRTGQEIDEPARVRFYICQSSLFEQARLERSIRSFVNGKMRCIRG